MRDVASERIRVGAIGLNVLRAGGPGTGPLVILLHGFPDLALTWRAQLHALGEAGFCAIAPDQRGHGDSDHPTGDAAYKMDAFVDDVVALVDHFGRDRAFLVGHDWGARTVWATVARAPARFPRIVAINSPWTRRPPRPPSSLVDPAKFSFLRYLAAPETPAKLDAAVARALRFFHARLYGATREDMLALHTSMPVDFDPLATPANLPLPSWLDETDFAALVDGYTRGGFVAPLARYRNLDDDWSDSPDTTSIPVRALYIGGGRDSATLLQPLRPMIEAMTGASRVVVIPEAGHSLPVELPGAVNRELVEFFA